jgi:hypothetical protein
MRTEAYERGLGNGRGKNAGRRMAFELVETVGVVCPSAFTGVSRERRGSTYAALSRWNTEDRPEAFEASDSDRATVPGFNVPANSGRAAGLDQSGSDRLVSRRCVSRRAVVAAEAEADEFESGPPAVVSSKDATVSDASIGHPLTAMGCGKTGGGGTAVLIAGIAAAPACTTRCR